MNINLNEIGIKLDELHYADNIGFSDGKVGRVIEINYQFGELYVQRVAENKGRDSRKFPIILEKIVYELGNSKVITGNSKGRVYKSKKIREPGIIESIKFEREMEIQGTH
jgi:hypothetical protein